MLVLREKKSESRISVKSLLFYLRHFRLPKGLGVNVMNGTSPQFRILTAPSVGVRGLINHLAATQAAATLILQMLPWETLCFFLQLESPEVWRRAAGDSLGGSAASWSRCVYTLSPWEITASRTPLAPQGNIPPQPLT